MKEEIGKMISIDKIIPWKKNPRNNNNAVKKVAESIKRFGFAAPIILNKDYTVIAGHTRLKASKLLNLKKVPCRILNLSKEEAELLALVDNKSGEIATWDEKALYEIIDNLPVNIDELINLGFEEEKLNEWLEEEFLPELGDADILNIDDTFSILIECKNDVHQRELLERFSKEGLECRAII